MLVLGTIGGGFWYGFLATGSFRWMMMLDLPLGLPVPKEVLEFDILQKALT